MADEQTQQNQDETPDDERDEAQDRQSDDARGDADKETPSDRLVKALNAERDARRKAESALRKKEQAERDAETQRAIKAGEWESVAKAKDTEIADLNGRIASLEAEIATSRLETVRERVAAKHKLPPELAARLRGDDEASLDADAKALAKLIVVKAPETELGKGGDRPGKQTDEEVIANLRKSGRYASVG
jgi:hypothetical protein